MTEDEINKEFHFEPLTAAMLLWAKEAYQSKPSVSYFEKIDLSSGYELMEQCNNVCDWFGKIITYKKLYLRNYLNEELSKSQKNNVVIILGAGKSPLALELLYYNSPNISRIIEVDLEGMNAKKELYDRDFYEYSTKIKCITADIRSFSILQILNLLLHDFYVNCPCFIIMESVSYFLDTADFKKLVSSFNTKNKQNRLLFDYLLPFENLPKELSLSPQKVFELITDTIRFKNLSHYSSDFIEQLIKEQDGRLIQKCTLVDIEKSAAGKNEIFKDVKDSWLECSAYKI